MAIDYAKFIDRMQPQPIPASYPLVTVEVQDSIAYYMYNVIDAITLLEGDKRRITVAHPESYGASTYRELRSVAERLVTNSFYLVVSSWNVGRSAQAIAEDLWQEVKYS